MHVQIKRARNRSPFESFFACARARAESLTLDTGPPSMEAFGTIFFSPRFLRRETPLTIFPDFLFVAKYFFIVGAGGGNKDTC